MLACALALGVGRADAQEAPLGDHAGRTLVVLAVDGLSPEAVAGAGTPALDAMARNGVRAEGLLPVFPSLALVSGFTLSTGCSPATHGIVSDLFRDPEGGRFDHDADADWLLACEGMHEAAERQGVRAAALGWYGAWSGERGALATLVSPAAAWSAQPGDLARAEEVADVLRLPPWQRPRLVLAYLKGPDVATQAEGIGSPSARRATRQADAAVARVREAIAAAPDAPRITLLVVGPHGATPVSRLVNLPRLLAEHGIEGRALAQGTTALLYLDDPGQAEAARAALDAHGPLTAWRPEAPPPGRDLGRHPRLGDVVVSSRPPYFMEDVTRWPAWARWLAGWAPRFPWVGLAIGASHGYPPEVPGMAGVLYAEGSGVARGRKVPPVRLEDVHPTVMALLGLEAGQPVEGRSVEPWLRTGGETEGAP